MHEKKSVNILLEVLLWLFSLVIIYPLGMVLMTSFKAYGESNILSIKPPTAWMFSNYRGLGKGKDIPVITQQHLYYRVLGHPDFAVCFHAQLHRRAPPQPV